MNAIVFLIETVVTAIYWLVIINVVLSWLVAFNVINLNNDIVRQIYHTVNSLLEPLLGPIRRVLPNVGGIDFSPLVLLIGVIFLRKLILEDLLPALM